MIRLALALAALTGPLAAGELPEWKAVSGDRIVLADTEFRLAGVTCPPPDTEQGRAAKALLNTFLRNGFVACRVANGSAECQKEGRDFAAGLLASGNCQATPAPALPANATRLVRDTGRLSFGARQARNTPGGCDASRAFVSQSREAACDAGIPNSLCQGTTGLRQFGRPVAPSGRYRSTSTTPSFNPFHCR